MENRLELLPDSMLTIIISSLPFKEAARTSILSKRWLKIWQRTKNIEFLESFFVQNSESDEIKDTQRRIFIYFTTNFTRSYQEPTVSKFTLAFSKPRNFITEMESCIEFAISHTVKALEIDFSDPTWSEENDENHTEMFDLPLSVYRHNKLESLKLFSCSFRVSEFVNLSQLKHLSLGWIEVSVRNIKDLLQNCKILESLSLYKCWNITHLEFVGKDLKLQSLVIEKCNLMNEWIFIQAPKLTYFRYSGNVGTFRFEVNRCMEEANLDFQIQNEYDGSEVGNNFYNLLEDFYSVKVLTVCSSLLQVIPLGDEPLGMQETLSVQHLTLNTAMHPNEFYGIKFLLKSCSYLETLTLKLGQGRILSDYEPPFPMDARTFWGERLSVDKCVRKTLKIVEVNGFTGAIYEFHFLVYLLFFGSVMERLILNVDADSDNREIYIQRAQILKQVQTRSQKLEIYIG